MSISLASSLDSAAAFPLLSSMREAVAAGSPIVLQGAGVARVGQACLQVLAAARDAAGDAGIAFTIEQPSVELLAAGALCGLDDLFVPSAR